MLIARVLAGLVFAALLPGAATAAPRVVASIKPIASLVAGVMDGVGAPAVIVGGGQSLHTFSLKPSDAKAISSADVVVWVGEGLEAFLKKPLASLSARATVIELAEVDGVTVLAGREGGVWEHKADNERHAHDFDGHIWLDPVNAKIIVSAVARALSKADGANAARYGANATALNARLDALDAELNALLEPVKARPFVVFHDAYQYLEKRYDLNAVGSLTVSPDRMPGARRVAEIKAKVKSHDAACVFAEPQFEPKLVRTLVEGTNAKVGTLDPEGATLPEGPDLYFNLMRALAKSLKDCFG